MHNCLAGPAAPEAVVTRKLNAFEEAELRRLEERVTKGIAGAGDMMKALVEIRRKRLYEAYHPAFSE